MSKTTFDAQNWSRLGGAKVRLKKIYSKAVRSSKFVFRFELERLIRREIANVETMTKATIGRK
jgi:hypothetical protein